MNITSKGDYLSAWLFSLKTVLLFVLLLLSVCNKSLGLESGLLPNSSFKSNYHSPGFEPWNARLNSPRPWCYRDKNSYGLLYIDLLDLTDVTGIASQKANHISLGFTEEIRIFYSVDNVHWKYYGGTGNVPKVYETERHLFSIIF